MLQVEMGCERTHFGMEYLAPVEDVKFGWFTNHGVPQLHWRMEICPLKPAKICSAISYRKLQASTASLHNDPALRARLGLEDNHYDEPIPYQEVVRRLFSWKDHFGPESEPNPLRQSRCQLVL